MNTVHNANDIVTFFENEDTRISEAALSKALKQFGHYNKYWFYRYDLRKKEHLYFFPLNYINMLGDEKPNFISIVKENWENAGFEICEQLEMSPNEHFEICIDTILFCLKKKH